MSSSQYAFKNGFKTCIRTHFGYLAPTKGIYASMYWLNFIDHKIYCLGALNIHNEIDRFCAGAHYI